jgi:hypothetical protein
MSPRAKSPDVDDPTQAAFEDDDERAEAEWLLARERDPSAPAPSPQLAAEHEELQGLLATLPEAPRDDSWRDAILKQVRASLPKSPPAPPAWWRRRWLQWSMGGGLAAVAAAAVALLLLQAQPSAPELEFAFRDGPNVREAVRGQEQANVGQQLIVTARPRGIAELRVFRSNGEMIARCPGGPACTVAPPGELKIEVSIDGPGRYHVILVSGLRQLLPAGNMNAYIDAALAVKAAIAPPREFVAN